MDFINFYASPLGPMTLASDGKNLTGLWFDGQKHFASGLSENPVQKDLLIFDQTRSWLDIYFSGVQADFTPPILLHGTDFQKSVWEELLLIPYGQTVSYGQIAKRIEQKTGAKKMSAQAVGGAVGRNPVSIIVPCHRVLSSKNTLTGYAAGLEIKKRLLEIEGVF